MRIASAIALTSLMLTSCGTFQLAGDQYTVPHGTTRDQLQLAILTCKDEARVRSQTAADQARGIALGIGLSFLGAYIDYRQQMADQRRIYKDCMSGMGIATTPPED